MAIRSPVSLREARRAFVAMRRAYITSIRRVIKERVERCDDRCKGWFIDQERDVAVVCDECATLGRYGHLIGDDDVAMLPEVRREVVKRFIEQNG